MMTATPASQPKQHVQHAPVPQVGVSVWDDNDDEPAELMVFK